MIDPISGLLGVHRLVQGWSVFDYAKFTEDIQKPCIILLDELSSTLSTRETLGAGRMVADGWSVLEATERCFLPFYEGSKTEGERSVVYKTFLRH